MAAQGQAAPNLPNVGPPVTLPRGQANGMQPAVTMSQRVDLFLTQNDPLGMSAAASIYGHLAFLSITLFSRSFSNSFFRNRCVVKGEIQRKSFNFVPAGHAGGLGETERHHHPTSACSTPSRPTRWSSRRGRSSSWRSSSRPSRSTRSGSSRTSARGRTGACGTTSSTPSSTLHSSSS